jgi:hypothetical protein
MQTESAPDSIESRSSSLEQPSPEVCPQPLYVATLAEEWPGRAAIKMFGECSAKLDPSVR